MSSKSIPQMMWAQRSSSTHPARNLICMTINLPEIVESTLDVALTPQSLLFKAKTLRLGPEREEREWNLKVNFFSEVDPHEPRAQLTPRCFQVVIQKKTLEKEYWPRLTQETLPPSYLRIDAARWLKQDEQEYAPNETPGTTHGFKSEVTPIFQLDLEVSKAGSALTQNSSATSSHGAESLEGLLREALEQRVSDYILPQAAVNDEACRLFDSATQSWNRFLDSKEDSDLDTAISGYEMAIALVPDSYHDKPVYLHGLAGAATRRHIIHGGLDDFRKAMSAAKDAVFLISKSHPDRSSYLQTLGDLYHASFQRMGEVEHLDDAILVFQEALRITSPGHHERPMLFGSIGSLLWSRYTRRGDLADLNDSITNHKIAAHAFAKDPTSQSVYLSKLGQSLRSRFERLGNVVDIDDAISYLEYAVHFSPIGHPSKPHSLLDLAVLYLTRFQVSGDEYDMDQAIVTQETAVEEMAPGHYGRSVALSSLGLSFLGRFESFHATSDLHKAIAHIHDAVGITPDTNPHKSRLLNILGRLLARRFDSSGRVDDIHDAVATCKATVALTPRSHPDVHGRLSNLGNALIMRFEQLANILDLEEAIKSYEEAVAQMPTGHPEELIMLANLASAYSTRFQHFGEVVDIDKAISLNEAVVLLTSNDDPALPGRLNNLGQSYSRRSERLGDTADTGKAIHTLEVALQLTQDQNPEKPILLDSIGTMYQHRFRHCGERTDIENSISSHRAAIQLLEKDDPKRPGRLSHLANSLSLRFQRFGDIGDIEEAVSYHQSAVNLTPNDHHSKISFLNNLGLSLSDRFERSHDFEDLHKAIMVIYEVIGLMPDSYATKPATMNNLGRLLHQRSELMDRPEDLTRAMIVWWASARSKVGPPVYWYRAAVACTKHAEVIDNASQKGIPSLRESFSAALGHLPRVAWLGFDLDSRYRELAAASTLACDAAAAALQESNAETALEWLEQGRSIVWGQMLQLRTPLDDLRAADPRLAEELARVSEILEGSTTNQISENMKAEDAAQKTRRAAEEWDKLVNQVRELAGSDRFLEPKQFSELRLAAREGPVVVLIASKLRCDALILPSMDGPLQHLPLDFTLAQAMAMYRSLRQVLTKCHLRDSDENASANDRLTKVLTNTFAGLGIGNDRHGNRKFKQNRDEDAVFRVILGELWTLVIKPILDILSIEPSSSHSTPRLWWCPTGPFVFLPIHAAGVYDANGTTLVSTADYVVSSYTPTLNALLGAFKKTGVEDIALLAVSQPCTPGASRLPGTEEELANLRAHAGKIPFQALEKSDATVEAVLSGMANHSWVHLACHGIQDNKNPAKSALLLEDGRLELATIIKKSMKQADLAFLSACETAMGDENRPDESIHLAAGMLSAGYRSVVATMWSIGDSDAPFVADKVYAYLMREGQQRSVNAARALHEAIFLLRERNRSCSFASWVPFVHVGY